MPEADRPPILGCIERLDDTRLVFLGQRADRPDVFYLGFRNSEGEDTKLIVSPEAMAAIIRLMGRLPTVAAVDRDLFPPALETDGQWHWVVAPDDRPTKRDAIYSRRGS